MTAREKILTAIRANKPAGQPLPLMEFAGCTSYGDKAMQFISVLTSIGGFVEHTSISNVQELLNTDLQSGEFIVNACPEIGTITPALSAMDAVQLQTVKRAYIKGAIGVAENGAVWVTEEAMVNRLLPFICEELVLVVKVDSLVPNMHEAYESIRTNDNGFGVFIAGPSKTADIEQSLVIGAHGAKALQVFLV